MSPSKFSAVFLSVKYHGPLLCESMILLENNVYLKGTYSHYLKSCEHECYKILCSVLDARFRPALKLIDHLQQFTDLWQIPNGP